MSEPATIPALLPPFDLDEAARMLRCEPRTVEERARRGELPGLLFGNGGWIFPRGAFYARLDELALEQAAARRQKPEPAATLRAVPAKRARRTPPVLPRP